MNTDKTKIKTGKSKFAKGFSHLCFICAYLWLSQAPAAYVSFQFTTQTGAPDTNYFKVQAVSGPVANADGSFTTIGLPIRINPDTNGYALTNLAQNNYFVTNSGLGRGFVIRVPLDSGANIYNGTCLWYVCTNGLAISHSSGGINVFVTDEHGTTNPPPTYNQITNALGYVPANSNNAVAVTGGQNVTVTTNGALVTIDVGTLTNAVLYQTAGGNHFFRNQTNGTNPRADWKISTIGAVDQFQQPDWPVLDFVFVPVPPGYSTPDLLTSNTLSTGFGFDRYGNTESRYMWATAYHLGTNQITRWSDVTNYFDFPTGNDLTKQFGTQNLTNWSQLPTNALTAKLDKTNGTAYGTLTVAGPLTVSGASTINGAMAVTAPLLVTGTATINSNLTVNASVIVNNAAVVRQTLSAQPTNNNVAFFAHVAATSTNNIAEFTSPDTATVYSGVRSNGVFFGDGSQLTNLPAIPTTNGFVTSSVTNNLYLNVTNWTALSSNKAKADLLATNALLVAVDATKITASGGSGTSNTFNSPVVSGDNSSAARVLITNTTSTKRFTLSVDSGNGDLQIANNTGVPVLQVNQDGTLLGNFGITNGNATNGLWTYTTNSIAVSSNKAKADLLATNTALVTRLDTNAADIITSSNLAKATIIATNNALISVISGYTQTNDTRAVLLTNVLNAFAAQRYLIGLRTNFVATTDNVAVFGAGTLAANGTYQKVSSTLWTNYFTLAYITNNGSAHILTSVAGTLLYSSVLITNGTWTTLAGAPNAPSSFYGSYEYGNGNVILGQVTCTNCDERTRIAATNIATALLANQGTTNLYLLKTNGTGFNTSLDHPTVTNLFTSGVTTNNSATRQGDVFVIYAASFTGTSNTTGLESGALEIQSRRDGGVIDNGGVGTASSLTLTRLNGVKTISLTGTFVDTLVCQSNSSLQAITFPNAKFISLLTVTKCPGLAGFDGVDSSPINAPYFYYGGTVTVATNLSLTYLDFPALELLTTVAIHHNDQLTKVKLEALETCGLYITTNVGLVTVSIPKWMPSTDASVDFSGNALDVATVDLILARCVANSDWGIDNEDLELSGGSNAAPTGGASNSNYLELIGRGATVEINP